MSAKSPGKPPATSKEKGASKPSATRDSAGSSTHPRLLGGHMSIAGGFHLALERGRAEGFDCVQVFTVPPRMWPVPPVADMPEVDLKSEKLVIGDEAVRAFEHGIAEHQIGATLVHASYLLNLASPDDALWRRSINGLTFEMLRASQLGIPAVVFHPGAFTTSSEAAGLARIEHGLREVADKMGDASALCLLENTAGQGSQLGHRLEQLAQILDNLAAPERFGVCLDTCHLFAAGYGLGTAAEYNVTVEAIQKTIGVDSVHAFHINDSKQPLGSRKDRHENIGEGEMGLASFQRLLNDDRFAKLPMYLETPKGTRGKQTLDAINLNQLRDLLT